MRDVGAGDAARVERPHRELRARLADRLGGDDPDRVADLRQLARREERAVARRHTPVSALHFSTDRTGIEKSSATSPSSSTISRSRGIVISSPFAATTVLPGLPDASGLWTSSATIRPATDLFSPSGRKSGSSTNSLRLAVLLADDHVLRDVDEAPRQVARVGGAQRRVGEALSGTVGRDEVLEHRQALHEVGLDRPLDDLALRIRHQAAHAGELAQLRERAAGAGVGHHVDRVQLVEVVDHRVRDLVGRLGPDRRDLLVALRLGDEPLVVGILDARDALLEAGEDLLLVRRDDDVVLRDRHAGERAVTEAEVLDRVEDVGDREGAVLVDELRDEVAELLLRERPVDVLVVRALVAVLRRGVVQ